MNKQLIYNKFKFFIISLFPFFAFWQLSNTSTFEPVYIEYFHLSSTEIGSLASIYTYADALFLIPVGLLLDRFTFKTVILAGVICLTFGLFGQMLSTSFYQLLLFRFIAGIGHAFALLSCFSYVKETVGQSKQITYVSLALTIGFLGGLISQSLTASLLILFNWYVVMLLFGLLQIMLLIVLIFMHIDIKKASNRQSISLANFKPSLANIKNYAWAVYISILDLPIMLIGALIGVHYLVIAKHVTLIEASSASSMIFVGTIVGTPILGSIADRFKNHQTQIISYGLIAAGCLLMVLISTSQNIILYALFFFLAGFFTSIQGLGYSAIYSINRSEISSTAMSIVNVIIMLLLASYQAIYTVLSGMIRDDYLFLSIPILIIFGALIGSLLTRRLTSI
ncbi:MFS transporter [Thiotrichales bacterium 19X7-9]|nr:MFS transporter [Thiotrichales bacterium 19X7-9]